MRESPLPTRIESTGWTGTWLALLGLGLLGVSIWSTAAGATAWQLGLLGIAMAGLGAGWQRSMRKTAVSIGKRTVATREHTIIGGRIQRWYPDQGVKATVLWRGWLSPRKWLNVGNIKLHQKMLWIPGGLTLRDMPNPEGTAQAINEVLRQ